MIFLSLNSALWKLPILIQSVVFGSTRLEFGLNDLIRLFSTAKFVEMRI